MTPKEARKYTLISQILTSQAREAFAGLTELANIDFTTAFEVWECVLQANQKDLADHAVATVLENKALEMFNALSETKTRQLLLASDPLIRLIYGACATAGMGLNLILLVNLILSSKLEAADVALSAIRSNSTGDFGERMRIIVDSVFKTYCESKGVKKCELNRKQSTLLLEYCAKIKGPNKMLLTQRIKEL